MMKKVTISISLLSALFYATLNFAQISPKEGVKPPANFQEFQQMIQSSYSGGYYADKFRERKQIREQISQGLLPESTLAEDTVSALTLMGQYTNLAGHYTQQDMQSKIYDGPNPTGTVTDYYTEVSYDQLYFTGDAKGWYDMPRTLQQYEGGNSGLGPQGGPRFVWEILQVSDPTLNYADYIQYYDGQGRPHIGFVAVIHSGADAAAGAFNIWSHRWDFRVFSGTTFTTNDIDPVSGHNVIIDGEYAIMPEREGNNNNSGPIINIGVFAHEFGHIFGLPDLYDTDQSSEGVGDWCLMASGNYLGGSAKPSHMCAWVKKELGWVTPINITSPQVPLSVPNVEENPIVYRMWRDGTIGNQYFLVENRQQHKFDTYIHNSGFLIYHVDDAIGNNNNENHYKVDVEQADGVRDLNQGNNRGDPGDPFPGSSQNTRFDFNTNPNSKDYSLQNTFVSVRNIYKDGNMMVGDFEVGPRSGASAYGDPTTTNFGGVEVGTTSLSKTVILTNYGDQNLEITGIPSSVGDFNLVSTHTFPITLSPYNDSLSLAFTFSPTTVGNAQEFYPIYSNDPVFAGFNMLGLGVLIYPALDKTIYASSGDMNNGEILTIDATTGAGTLLGSSLFDEVKSLSIHPTTGSIYGLVSRGNVADIVKVNSGGGDSYLVFTLDILQMACIAFDTSGTLYGITRSGDLYTIDLTNGSYNFEIDAMSAYAGMTFHPGSNELWATSRSFIPSHLDAVFKVNLSTGDTTLVGHTGLGKETNDIVFDENFNLFGVIGSENDLSDFISINTTTGVIGSVGFKNILGLAFEETGVTSVEETDNELIPSQYSLSQNYPNPFNPSTSIEFTIPAGSNVTLTIYNLLGQVVTRLIDQEVSSGSYSIVWNGNDMNGLQVSSGIYF
jgi:M6 family metalloprotease-like protein